MRLTDVGAEYFDRCAAIAAQIRTGQRHIGLMLHHETLEAEDLSALAELLAVMRGQPRARCVNIVDFGDN